MTGPRKTPPRRDTMGGHKKLSLFQKRQFFYNALLRRDLQWRKNNLENTPGPNPGDGDHKNTGI